MTTLMFSFGVLGQSDFVRNSALNFSVLVLFLISTFGSGVFDDFDMVYILSGTQK